MKDFWKKTKETFAVGVAKADEFINDKKIETDAEYLERENKLSDMDNYITKLHKNLDEMNGNIKRAGNIFSNIGSNFKESISTTSPDYADFASKAHETGTTINQYTQKVFEFYYPTYALSPLNKALDELKNLKKINNDCKKAHILLNNAEESLKRSRNSKNANIPKHEQEVEERKAEYNKLHAEFIQSVDEFVEKKGQICSDAYTAAVIYIDELMKISRGQFTENIPQCTAAAKNEKYPSIEVSKSSGENKPTETTEKPAETAENKA